MANILFEIGQFLLQAIDFYRIILLVYFLMSWLPGAYQSTIGQILTRICEPYVGFFRQFIPPIGMISLAGLAAYFSLTLVEYGVIAIINFLGRLLV